MTRLQLTLQDNAIDSFRRGIDAFIDAQSPVDWKEAIIQVSHAIELFLKVRLAQEGADLIYVQPTQSGEPGARTIGYAIAIKRLKDCGVLFSSNQEQDIAAIRGVRNEIEHFQVDIEQTTVEEYLVRSMRFLDEFLHDELGLNVLDIIVDTARFDTLKSQLYTTEERIKQAEERAEALLPGRPKDRLLANRVLCPECYVEAVAINETQQGVRCEHCGTEWSRVDQCDQCGEPTPSYDGAEWPIYCAVCGS